MVGIAGLCGLAASLAWIPLRLPLFCFLSRHLWRLRCGRDAVVGVGDGVGLRSRPRSRSSSACAKFNSKNVVLPTSSRNSRLYARFKIDRRDEDVQKHCYSQDKKHENTVLSGEREAAASARAAILCTPEYKAFFTSSLQ